MTDSVTTFPTTGNLPVWVCWLAQDADGSWWAYEAEPLQFSNGWYENEVGRRLKLGDDVANPKWQQTLIRVQKANRPATQLIEF